MIALIIDNIIHDSCVTYENAKMFCNSETVFLLKIKW